MERTDEMSYGKTECKADELEQGEWIFFDMKPYRAVWERMARGDACTLASLLYRLPQAAEVTGSLWQYFLTGLIIRNENPYSLFWERRKDVEPWQRRELEQMAYLDFSRLYEMFKEGPFLVSSRESADHILSALTKDARQSEEGYSGSRSYSRSVICRLCNLLRGCADAGQFQETCRQFYVEYGVGDFALHRAFVPSDDGADLVPVRDLEEVSLSDLIGYEKAKQKLVDNTRAFVAGKRANNCLLFGDAGTGKSTSVKAILHQYAGEGLRMIEVYKHQFRTLAHLLQKLKRRNYRFIIFMDDLSFEEFEIEYKYLKAVIEGGLSKKPENVLIYATSNRRHLIKENFSDKASLGNELHGSDTVQEKLSLVARFGLTIYFGAPEKKEYDAIVRELARRNNLSISDEELMLAAGRFSLQHGGRSGRGASQLIDHLLSDQRI